MLSIARSPRALLVQLLFLGFHALATLLGTIYQNRTPELYPKNSHSPVGWVATWIVVAQCCMEMIILASRDGKEYVAITERSISAPLSIQALEQYREDDRNGFRDSSDQEQVSPSAPSRSRSVSSTGTYTQEEQQRLYRHDTLEDDELPEETTEKQEFLHKRGIGRLANGLVAHLSRRTMSILLVVHNVVNRMLLLLGFVALGTGLVVYGGVFVSNMPYQEPRN